MSAKTRRKRKTWIIWVIVIVTLAAILLVGRQILLRRVDPLANVRSTKAVTGTVARTVTGTGNLSADDTTIDLTILDGLVIDQLMVKAGDSIAAGDLAATFDAESLQAAIWSTQADIAALDAQINLAKDKTESQYITTTVAGRIKKIAVSEGDKILDVMAEQGALMILSLDGKMKVTFPSTAVDSQIINEIVDVILSDGTKVEGELAGVSDNSYVVTLSDKSAPLGDLVTIRLDDQELGNGYLEISEPLTITATDGVAAEIRYKLNDKVSSGARLVKLESAPVSQHYLKLYTQRNDLADRLATLMRYTQDGGYIVDQSGEILVMTIAEGQPTSSPGSNGAAATIRTSRNVLLMMKIDELDIAALAVGQTAELTIDALPGLKLPGTITDIAQQGTVGQSSSTFTVEIDVPDDAALRLGLTTRAVIIAEKRDNIVKIPLAALQEAGGEQYVYIGTPVSAANLGEKRLVTLGLSDGEYVEITEGLSSGETVNYYYADGNDNLYPFPGSGIRQNSSTAD